MLVLQEIRGGLAVFGTPAPRLRARFRGLGSLGLCASLRLLRRFRRFARRLLLCPGVARTQVCGFGFLGLAAFHAGLFLRSSLGLAARLNLRGLALAGFGIGFAHRHSCLRRGGSRFVRGGVALRRCAARSDAASLFLLGEGDVRYRGVELLDPEPRHALDAVRDPAPHLLDGLQDVLVVFDPHLEIYGCLRPPDLDGDPARLALRTRQAPQYPAGGPRGASAHVDALHLLRRHAGYRGDYSVTDCRSPAIAQERAFTTLLP